MLKSYSEKMPKSLSDILLYEVDSRWSREAGEFAPSEMEIPMGAVLAQNEAGLYVPFGFTLEAGQEAVDASEGVEAKEAVPAKLADKPVAILISRKILASEEPQPCAVIRRGACVAKNSLFWLGTVTEEEKKAALGELASLGIIPKE